ncbi:CSS-motif domain-containing protein, partial [Pseudomonas aeruginosa]|uniref:CSS-motif domain-containing protein n=1 Tax=Pseudomonas aeruginosa TaxID=287 RepID=UPI0031B75CCC
VVGKPCREVLGRLTRMTMLSPYFRSLVLVERENVYCSSLRGELHDLPLQVAFKALGSLPAGQRITPSNATPIKDAGKIIGVVSVAKPNSSLQP